MIGNNKKCISIYADIRVYEKIKKMAAERGLTLSSYVNILLTRAVENNN